MQKKRFCNPLNSPLSYNPPSPCHDSLPYISCQRQMCLTSGGHADAKSENSQSGEKKGPFDRLPVTWKDLLAHLLLRCGCVNNTTVCFFSFSFLLSLRGNNRRLVWGRKQCCPGRCLRMELCMGGIFYSPSFLSLCLPPWNPSTLAFPPNPPTLSPAYIACLHLNGRVQGGLPLRVFCSFVRGSG